MDGRKLGVCIAVAPGLRNPVYKIDSRCLEIIDSDSTKNDQIDSDSTMNKKIDSDSTTLTQ